MPYIKSESRAMFEAVIATLPAMDSTGELNFVLTTICAKYINDYGKITYNRINDVMGALSAVSAECYRRIAAPYEDMKIKQNGDINAFEQFGLDEVVDR